MSSFTITVNDDDWQAIKRKLEKVTKSDVLLPAAQYLATQEKQNPPTKAAGAFTKLATPGQRRAYWAKVKSGEASHGAGGYIRSGRTAGGWRAFTRGSNQAVAQNKAPAAQWVYGRAEQQPFHAESGFMREDNAMRFHGDGMIRAVDRKIGEILR